ncbi:sterol desaturase [Kiloniella spongiae]|uniref:Sterol desaturase n=1 Tax=Kiloniella spongiae TaxID=1489064 RepID=A0A0H2ME44_9PROT|nr:sterol desaturase family protein [Kiloniella spongiae]KLN60834.1 sterol desaturase [Kiloniella spongiae]
MENLVTTLLAYKGGLVFLWLLFLFVFERAFPAVPLSSRGEWLEKYFPIRVRRNIGLWFCNLFLSPFVVIPLTAWATSHIIGWRPEFLSGNAGIIFDLILLDVLIYWWHRLNHEIPFLWRFHEIHHLDTNLDTTSALRFHFGEVLLSALMRVFIVVIFDIPLISIIIFEIILLISTLFHHSNVRLPGPFEKALSLVIVTPAIHWVHHHALRDDTDSNYGTVFSFWDKIFRSKSKTQRTVGMAIGVEGAQDKALLQLLIRPFKKRNL